MIGSHTVMKVSTAGNEYQLSFEEEMLHHFEGNLKYKWLALHSEYVMTIQLYIYSEAWK